MSIPRTREEAYELLELPNGVDQDSIRNSYKRLALKWHPEKHSNSPEAKKKFQLISRAYKKLMSGSSTAMAYEEMLRLFKDIFYTKSMSTYNGNYDSSEEDDDDEDDDDDEEEDEKYFNKKSRQDRKKSDGLSSQTINTQDICKSAEELITEEEREKRKAEKRRAKKKRRREKKKIEKLAEVDKKSGKQKHNSSDMGKKNDKINGASLSCDETDFDQHSAFFTTVVNKKKKGQVIQESSKKEKNKDRLSQSSKTEEESEDLGPVVLRSRQLAIRGNEMAQLGQYTAAIELFTEAIHLDSRDFRFFGNRSYCFDRTEQYDKALRDAEKAINLSPDWPKGYFRKGRALAGLRLFPDAEQSFMQVLKLDKNCEEAVQELLRVRTFQITEMGFSQKQAEAAIKQFSSVQSALDSLLAGVVADHSLNSSDVYLSDEDDFSSRIPTSPQIKNPSDIKMDPRNPDGLTALWVGNVLPEVKEKHLNQLFSKYGNVTSVRCLPEKYCAFVNFKTKESAGRAMQILQGHECSGQRLLIKFPDNPICNGNGGSIGVTTIRKSNPTSPSSKQSHIQLSQSPTQLQPKNPELSPSGVKNMPKQTGPVNGDECYFWRTTGCQFGDKCHYRHLPDHRGVDKKPWQRVK